MAEMQQTTIYIPRDINLQSKQAAKKKGISLAGLIRMLLIEYLEKDNKK